MKGPLAPLLSPRSIAIVGASGDLRKLNGRPIANLLRDGYAGRILPVNPSYPEIAGLKCFPDVESLPEVPDLGVVGVGASRAVQAVEALAAKGVRFIIVWSAGFAEAGAEGARLEEDLMRVARARGVRVCGPNTLGLTNAFERMPLTFSQYADQPIAAGPVAFVSQSGAFGTAVATSARERGIGLGYFVSTGNQADLTVADVLDEVLDDTRISVVVAYLEGLKDGLAFARVADKAARMGKPLIVVKVGRQPAGRRAAVSHTGSLAGDDAVFDSIVRQFGVLRAQDETQALDLAAALTCCPAAEGDGLGLITISGGAGAMMADFAEDAGLQVPVLREATQAALGKVLRGFASLGNPVDVTGQVLEDVSMLTRSLAIVLGDDQVAVAVMWVQSLHRQADEFVDLLVAFKATAAKPFVLCWLNPPAPALQRLRDAGVCVTDRTQGCIQAAAGLVAFGRTVRMAKRRQPFPVAPTAPARANTERRNVATVEAGELLARAGLKIAPTRLARTAEEAARVAGDLGFPVAVKIESSDLPHKTEAGGVRLSLADAAEVRAAFADVMRNAQAFDPAARIEGVVVQAMARPGTELVLGLKRDPAFGPIVMVGLGGIFIEVLKDVVFAVPPLDEEGALAMIGRIRAQPLLRGARGKPPVDARAVAQALCALSCIALAHPDIAELDLNPVFAADDAIVAVDWLMVRD
ncbi:MAG TPA: acetate--CoA ligase family protein [Ramlibacter sp.]|uniref:acetate--CoA ligase family protein n=1 Tax=Ramlibacter sp. TaxID=1917967 RepID=UPI002C92B612|nr:acetate--CoA ligase family protein [Ramlibacter sp.]HVZ42659.1 acetate--CoA ligase family protein [Ramlibacter sp.]